jgi:hypothetical protein
MRMRWAGHVTHIGRREILVVYWWESQEERDHWEDQDVCGWIILKGRVERYEGMVWTGSIWLRIGTSGGLL